eukprot:gb/GECG01006352.1/.p1 GENE.gb/GECG01006352.1/~~gb/GECG01006352.1/.p1  ORF type:complete len:380 (+),score=35.11 gb/GECG01006352.1/:1-1140(+)
MVVLARLGETMQHHSEAMGGSDPVEEGHFSFILSVSVNLLAGLLVFRHGMSQLSSNVKNAFGETLKEAIRVSCEKPIFGLLTGVLSTACLSSATVASVMVVDFISVNAMTFAQSLAVSLGINVGSTLTPHLAALKLSRYYSFLMVGGKLVIPYLVKAAASGRSATADTNGKHKGNGNGSNNGDNKGELIGNAIFGLGVLFLGMDLLNSAVHPLQTYKPFLQLLTSFNNPLLALIVSCVVTVFLYSCTAFLGIVMALANQGMISMDLTIIFVLGTNIGAGAQPVIASFGKSSSSKRMAAAYAIFRGGTALILLPFIHYFESILLYLGGPLAPMATHIANAHSLFNICAALFFFPFTEKIGNFVESMIPATPVPAEQKEKN